VWATLPVAAALSMIAYFVYRPARTPDGRRKQVTWLTILSTLAGINLLCCIPIILLGAHTITHT
jgi:hypothetical protein